MEGNSLHRKQLIFISMFICWISIKFILKVGNASTNKSWNLSTLHTVRLTEEYSLAHTNWSVGLDHRWLARWGHIILKSKLYSVLDSMCPTRDVEIEMEHGSRKSELCCCNMKGSTTLGLLLELEQTTQKHTGTKAGH